MYNAMFVELPSIFRSMFVEVHSMYNDTVGSSNYTVRTALCHMACAAIFFQCSVLCSSSFTIQYLLC